LNFNESGGATWFQPTTASVRDLFEAFADALLPYSDASMVGGALGAMGAADAWEPEAATLHYGYNAELALRAAAHMALNLAAASRPGNAAAAEATSKFTLIIDPTTPPSSPDLVFGGDRELRLDDARLATSANAGLRSSYVNLFPVQTQPFLVE